MTRPREFDTEIVTDRALDLFSRAGFAGVSLADLETVTGVGRKGLYNTFGSKRGLFIEALKRYEERALQMIIVPLETEGAGRAEIVRVFGFVASPDGQLKGNRGCLFCLTAKSEVARFEDVGARVSDYFGKLRHGFLCALQGARKAGDLAPQKDPEVLADFLIGTVMGLSAMARAHRPAAQVKHYVETALAALN